MIRPRPQTAVEELIEKPEAILLIILNLVFRSDIKEAYCISSNPLFKKMSVGRNIQGRGINVEEISLH